MRGPAAILGEIVRVLPPGIAVLISNPVTLCARDTNRVATLNVYPSGKFIFNEGGGKDPVIIGSVEDLMEVVNEFAQKK